MSSNISTQTTRNAAAWNKIAINPNDVDRVNAAADRLYSNAARYGTISKEIARLGWWMPWQCIAIMHEREAGGSFSCYLGNGQDLDQVTTQVPAGRGPFLSHAGEAWVNDAFARGCYDALLDAPPRPALRKDWSAGGILTMFEEFNGMGYADRGLPSPYVWACTPFYAKGKFIADGKFDPDTVDRQIGCAALLQALLARDKITIESLAPPPLVAKAQPQGPKMTTETATATVTTAPAPAAPAPSNPWTTIEADAQLGLNMLSNLTPLLQTIFNMFPGWGNVASIAVQVIPQIGMFGLNAVNNVMQSKGVGTAGGESVTAQHFMTAYGEVLNHMNPEAPNSGALNG